MRGKFSVADVRVGGLDAPPSVPTGIRYDEHNVYFVNGCGCEARLEPIGSLMLWRSVKKCEAHRG